MAKKDKKTDLDVSRLMKVFEGDGETHALLTAVRDIGPPDAWIGAGYIRNRVWDHLHDNDELTVANDIDVVYFDWENIDPAMDKFFENSLNAEYKNHKWQVRNQATMHDRNDDDPYEDLSDALEHWPETATAVAMRLNMEDKVEVLAPFGLDDLFNMIIRPTPHVGSFRPKDYMDRLESKDWKDRWPKVQVLGIV
jgi:hypothetical protein